MTWIEGLLINNEQERNEYHENTKQIWIMAIRFIP